MKALKSMILPILAVAFLFSTSSVFSQEKSELNKKLAELKGKVEKVTVKVDGKDVVFEGKEAENLVKKMKSTGLTSFAYSMGDDKLKKRGYKIITRDSDDLEEVDAEAENVMITLNKSGEADGVEKKIKVEKTDGKTKVTITDTDKEGKEIEKVLEGEEAEKYLKENNEGNVIITEGRLRSHMPRNVKIVKGKPLRIHVIEKDTDGEDDEDVTATYYITKPDKAAKEGSVVIKKKKTEVKKENKED